MGTHLSFISAYHLQTDGQTERVNQVLEDVLRACILSYGKHWEKCLPLAEFSYNNSFQASLSPVSDQFNGVLHLLPYRASKGAQPRLARKLML